MTYRRLSNPASQWALAAGALIVAAGLLRAAEPRVILQEDFESYATTKDMRASWRGGTGVLDRAAPGGGQAALHNGGNLNAHYGLSVSPDATNDIVVTADLYDFGTNSDKRTTVALRYNSDQSLEFGMLNEGCCYYARAIGFGVSKSWRAFDQLQQPVRGWHRFQATISLTNTVVTLDLGADGTIDKTLVFDGRAPLHPFTMVRFGGLPARTSHGGPVLVDNIKVELVPHGQSVVLNGTPASDTSTASEMPATELAPQPPPQAAREQAAKPQPAGAEPTPVAAIEPAPPTGGLWSTAVWGITVALLVVIGLLAWMALLLRRSFTAQPKALLPADAASASQSSGQVPAAAEAASGEEWKERALAAEALADKQAQILREQVVPELTQFAKKSLVQGLYTQRNELVETQRKAQAELAELESRLAALHLPLRDRISAYEQRILELEKELETRGEDMRELIKATLLLVRERLDEERQKEHNRLN